MEQEFIEFLKQYTDFRDFHNNPKEKYTPLSMDHRNKIILHQIERSLPNGTVEIEYAVSKLNSTENPGNSEYSSAFNDALYALETYNRMASTPYENTNFLHPLSDFDQMVHIQRTERDYYHEFIKIKATHIVPETNFEFDVDLAIFPDGKQVELKNLRTHTKQNEYVPSLATEARRGAALKNNLPTLDNYNELKQTHSEFLSTVMKRIKPSFAEKFLNDQRFWAERYDKKGDNIMATAWMNAIVEAEKAIYQKNKPSEQTSDDLNKNSGDNRKGAKLMNANVTVIGKVVSELEIREIPGGTKVGEVNIVVPSGKKDEEGKGIGDNFYTLQVWDEHRQESLKENLKKGELIAVSGNLDVNTYTKKDGSGTGVKMIVKNPDITYIGKSANIGKATAVITGHLTKDPELSKFDNSRKTSLSVAVNDTKGEDVDFYTLELWNEKSKVADYLKKGSKISAFGNLKYDIYTKNDGTAGVSVKIVDPQISFLDKKKENEQSKPAAKTAQSKDNNSK